MLACVSDEIPVGSPPVPPGRHAAPGGWYADPAKPGQERYWDGWNWTRNTRPAETPTPGAGQGPFLSPAADPGAQAFGGAPVPAYARVAATTDGVALAQWPQRALAMIIDALLVLVLVEPIAFVTGLSARAAEAQQRAMDALQQMLANPQAHPDINQLTQDVYSPAVMGLRALTLVIAIVYGTAMIAWRGQTVGKMALGIRVVPVDEGRHVGGLGVSRALKRQGAYQLMTLIWPLDMINVLMPLWERRRQSLHDKIAKTQVVRTR